MKCVRLYAARGGIHAITYPKIYTPEYIGHDGKECEEIR